MLRKTDKYMKRRAAVWQDNNITQNDFVTEIIRRESWWLLGIIPLYIRDTILEKKR